jgi:hypothetical protein
MIMLKTSHRLKFLYNLLSKSAEKLKNIFTYANIQVAPMELLYTNGL